LNVIFDLDGTLTDPKEGILGSLCHALRSLSISPPPYEELLWVIGPPLQVSIPRLLDSEDPMLCAACLRLYRERFGDVGLFENSMYEDIPLTLAELSSRGHRLWVATSKPTLYSERILEHFALSQNFEAVYGSELDGTRTNKGELIAHLLDTEGLDPRECVMVGDREHDILGARANAIPSIGVLYGYGTREELESAGAYALVASPIEIPPTIVTAAPRYG
jgi:phosphoglycolate phosphatase